MSDELDATPMNEHPELLLSEYESISKQIVELTTARNNLGNMILNHLESAQARKRIIDSKFADRMDPTEKAVEKITDLGNISREARF